jgi:hypothetical protein
MGQNLKIGIFEAKKAKNGGACDSKFELFSAWKVFVLKML